MSTASVGRFYSIRDVFIESVRRVYVSVGCFDQNHCVCQTCLPHLSDILSTLSDAFIKPVRHFYVCTASVRCLPHLSDISTVSGGRLLNLSDTSNASVRCFSQSLYCVCQMSVSHLSDISLKSLLSVCHTSRRPCSNIMMLPGHSHETSRCLQQCPGLIRGIGFDSGTIKEIPY